MKRNREIKDTVFKLIFSQPENYTRLAKELGEARDGDSVELLSIRNLFVKGMYNDLGLLVNGKELILLVEAQSTNPVNIGLRCLLYACHILENFISAESDHTSIYGRQVYKVPAVKAYAIYTGTEAVPYVINSLDNFVGREGISFNVGIIKATRVDGLIYEYTRFCIICNEVGEYAKDANDYAMEVIRRCRAEGILTDLLDKHEREVIGMLNQEQYQRLLDEAMVNEALSEGEKRGVEESVRRLMRNAGVSEQRAREMLGADKPLNKMHLDN